MKVVAQRASEGAVRVGDETIGSIGRGLVLLVGIGPDDTVRDAEALADKIAGLRVFSDDAGHMNLDLAAVGGSILAVSQFTLLADLRKGRRPSFVRAAPPELAEPLFDEFVAALCRHGIEVATGQFGAQMEVALVNDGPVTILLETRDGRVI